MKYVFIGFCMLLSVVIYAQGPPITADKPIMLGAKSFTVRTLTEIRTTNQGTSTYIPLMFHYLPTSNTLVALHVPIVAYNVEAVEGFDLADVQLLAKYQFYRKDGTGKTHRLVAKSLQSFPTGKALDLLQQSTRKYQSYVGVVSGYESLKYGISTELGYNWSPQASLDELRLKQGFGLPLLKPQYPNKQVNLYFEYTSNWLVEREWYQLLYAQGIQYARKNITIDLAIQFPLINKFPENRKLKRSLFLGTRYSF